MAIDQILLFTQNKGKVAEFNQMLSTTSGASDIEIVDSTVVPLALRNPEETGQTFVENAVIKAVAGYTATGACCGVACHGLYDRIFYKSLPGFFRVSER